MKNKVFIYLLLLFGFNVEGQDIYNSDLIRKLKVKSEKTIRIDYYNKDTTITHYDISGREIYRKTQKGCMQGIDSTFYVKSTKIRKKYSDELKLRLIDKQTTKKKGNVIIYDFIQFGTDSDIYQKNTVLKLKNGILSYRKEIENGNIINLYYSKIKKNEILSSVENVYQYDKKNKKLLNITTTESKKINGNWQSKYSFTNYKYSNFDTTTKAIDTVFNYLDENDEYVESFQDGKLISYLIFDTLGNIIESANYVHNKPLEVSIYQRKYNLKDKTFIENISIKYYYENGLLKKWVDTSSGCNTTYEYEFY